MYRSDIEGMEKAEEWLSYLSDRGRSDKTIQVYRSAMRHNLNVLHDAGFDTNAECMGEREVYYLFDDEGKESSRRLRIHVFCSFVEWATGRDPAEDSALLWNGEEKDRCFITSEQFAKLWQMADPRERVILALGACMGLRRSEITGLRLGDIDGDRMTIYGKGHGRGKRAVLRVPDVVRDTIREYMAVRPQTSTDYLIVDTVYGRIKGMEDHKLYDIVKALGDCTGIEVTPHALRRLFATTLRDREVALDDIKTLMRHSKIETTLDCYIRPNPARLDGIMSSFSI